MSRATAQVVPDMPQALPIRTATTIKRSAVKREDLHTGTYCKSVKKDQISQDNQQIYYLHGSEELQGWNTTDHFFPNCNYR